MADMATELTQLVGDEPRPHWPPPCCPGADDVLLAALGQTQEGPPLDFAEVFAGNGAVHRALHVLGYRGQAMDRDYCADHDVLRPSGLLVLLSTCLDLKPGGILWAAPPCSTWVFLSRATTGRHVLIEGDTLSHNVVSQNALVERLVLALEICTLRGVFWILEQPANSVLWQYPAMRDCMHRHGLAPCTCDMGAYGGTSQKPTHLVGTAPYLSRLDRRCTQELKLRLQIEGVQTTSKWVDEDGVRRCQGTADLKSTQAYPEGFGAAHARAFLEHFGPPAALGQTAGAGSSSSTSSSTWPRSTTDRRETAALFGRLPAAVQAATTGAWWLRDFKGELWVLQEP